MHSFSVPPKSLTLSQPEAVRAGETLQLACTAKDSQPKTTLMWYRGDNPIPDGAGKTHYPGFRISSISLEAKLPFFSEVAARLSSDSLKGPDNNNGGFFLMSSAPLPRGNLSNKATQCTKCPKVLKLIINKETERSDQTGRSDQTERSE